MPYSQNWLLTSVPDSCFFAVASRSPPDNPDRGKTEKIDFKFHNKIIIFMKKTDLAGNGTERMDTGDSRLPGVSEVITRASAYDIYTNYLDLP